MGGLTGRQGYPDGRGGAAITARAKPGATTHFEDGSLEDDLPKKDDGVIDRGPLHSTHEHVRAHPRKLRQRAGATYGSVAGSRPSGKYLQAGLVDEMHVGTSPILLGRGEHLLGGIDLLALGYQVSRHLNTPGASHVVLTRK